MIADFENWPKLSSNFSNAKVLMSNQNRHVAIVNSNHGILNPPLVTIREFIDGKQIKFTHIVPSFPIQKHYGDWNFQTEKKGRTKLVITHNFQCHLGIIGKIIASFIVSPFFMKPHTRLMLEQMKRVIESF